jgi:O-antigen ligase
MFFISLILIKKYRLLLSLISVSLFIALGTYYFSSEETKYFILDTITFQNSSSLGHLVKWIQGVLSIIDNPLGSGLGTSGNSLSVDDQISVGGENQFIIIGVQMGLLGLINYVGLIYYSIRNSYKLYNLEEDFQLKYLPFIVCCLKFSLIFPLMTSNAEIYTFLSLFGWFLVGLSERRLDKLKLIN